jgi:hypothetical protein
MHTIASSLLLLTIAVQPCLAAPLLKLALSPRADGYVLGEPVAVHVTLTNAGEAPAPAPQHLGPEYGDVRYTIGRDGAEAKVFSPLMVKEGADAGKTLPPKASLEDDADLFFGADGWTFREAGTYTVTAAYGDDVVSPAVRVVVHAPSNADERTAAERLLSTPEAGRFLLLRGGDHLRAGVRVLEEIARDQPSTPQAAYANLTLGLNNLRPARDFTTGKARPANPTKALELLQSARDDRFGLERIVEKQLGLSSAYRQVGRDADADATEAGLPAVIERRFPQTDLERFRTIELPAIRNRVIPAQGTR